MITNLFSIFDPSTPNIFSANWNSILLILLIVPTTLWSLPSRLNITFTNIRRYITKEFKPLTRKRPYVLITVYALFIFIVSNNIIGLLPFIFTASRHLLFSLTLALPIWLAFIFYGWINNTSNLLAHLIPQETPVVLIPFIVIIETISNLIRPGTLAVRLSANIIAGHLLIVLLTSATPSTPAVALPILISAQLALSSLEIAVAFIQAYVIRVLITLYAAEFSN